MPKRARCHVFTAALAVCVLLAFLSNNRHCDEIQALTGLTAPLLAERQHHHIYQNEEAEHYSCDFSFVAGAWTSRAVVDDPMQRAPGDAAPHAAPLHLAAGSSDVRTFHSSRSSESPLYGTAEAQAIIWAHQHPQDCRSQRYLIHSPQVAAGIGSQLHVLGLALAVAMDTNRVLLLNTDVQRALYTDDPYCGPERPNLDECYFERLSNCTLADVELSANLTAATARLLDLHHGALDNLQVVVNDQLLSTPERAASQAAAHDKLAYAWVPRRLQRLVDGSPVAPAKHFYWYRAQASMFIVRPNIRTRAAMARLRRQTLQGQLPSYESAISVHVRHGDKWKEALEQPAQVYFEQAKLLHSKARGALNREILLSTDDPAVVSWFAQNATRWHVSYTNSSRKPDPQKSTWEYAKERGYAAEYLDALLNLELALECGGWVGTLTSNWCRLIDELRSTARCRADGMYVDAAQGDLPDDLGWRR